MAAEQQRRLPRVPLVVEVTLESEHNFFTGITDNISEGGVFVATPAPPPLGSEVGFELVLGGERFAVTGRVCWLREERAASADAPAGCGVRWARIDNGALAAIRRFVNMRDTDFYED